MDNRGSDNTTEQNPTPLASHKVNSLNTLNSLNMGVHDMSNAPQLKWVYADHFCHKSTAYINYAQVMNAHDNYTYFVSALKNGTFHLHTIEYNSREKVEKISQIYDTMEEAQQVAEKHYLRHLEYLKVFHLL